MPHLPVHVTACAYWALATLSRDENMNSSSWVYGDELADADLTTQYTAAYYWAVMSLMANDYEAETNGQRIFSMAVTLLGVLITAAVVGGAVSVVQSLTAVAEMKNAEADSITHFLK